MSQGSNSGLTKSKQLELQSELKHSNWSESYLGDQPNGGREENCLTSFRQGSANPLWYDRPCDDIDATDEPGHRFMCECKVEDHEKQSEPLTSEVIGNHLVNKFFNPTFMNSERPVGGLDGDKN